MRQLMISKTARYLLGTNIPVLGAPFLSFKKKFFSNSSSNESFKKFLEPKIETQATRNEFYLRYPQSINNTIFEHVINAHTIEDATHSRLFISDWKELILIYFLLVY